MSIPSWSHMFGLTEEIWNGEKPFRKGSLYIKDGGIKPCDEWYSNYGSADCFDKEVLKAEIYIPKGLHEVEIFVLPCQSALHIIEKYQDYVTKEFSTHDFLCYNKMCHKNRMLWQDEEIKTLLSRKDCKLFEIVLPVARNIYEYWKRETPNYSFYLQDSRYKAKK